jgi:predicted dehydrogenase
MGHADVEVAAICDVDDDRMTNDYIDIQKKYGKKPAVYKDYRRMLEHKDINAIIVGSPDHWHALHHIHACEAGKDVYCEKPISHNIVEARSMAAAAKRFGRVVQVGTWQRSTREFTDAIAYIRSGKLGKITHCRAWIADGTRIGRAKPSNPPPNLDFDFWVGPAQMFPYQSNKVHWNWRWVMNTGGGLTTDWGVHMMDIALLGMSQRQDLVMPYEVVAYGGQWAIADDDRDAPDTIEALLRFKDPDFVMTWSVLRDHPGKPGHCTEFVSADGKTLRVWRGGWQVLDADGKELPKEQAPPTNDHWRNWLDFIKSRQAPRADFASVAQTTIVCHLVNASLYAGQSVRFDKATMDIVGRAGKDTLAYNREYRRPWSLPVYRP